MYLYTRIMSVYTVQTAVFQAFTRVMGAQTGFCIVHAKLWGLHGRRQGNKKRQTAYSLSEQLYCSRLHHHSLRGGSHGLHQVFIHLSAADGLRL